MTYASPSAGVSTITTPGNRTWRISNSGNLITAVRRPSASSDTTTISYSGSQVTSVIRDGIATGYNRTVSGTTATMVVTDAQSNTTTVVSDMTKFRPTSVTDGRGKTTTVTYDSLGRPDTVTFPEGNKLVYGYDSRGNLQITTRKAKAGSGLTDTYTTASFDSTCTNIATCNSPNWVQDALGNRTDYTYDSTTGLLLSETAPAATTGAKRAQTRYSYTTNSAGVTLLTGISQCQTGATTDTPSCVGTADEVKTTIAYDANLNVTSLTKADGATTPTLSVVAAATYDLSGNLITVDGPLSGTNDTTTFRYDADRNQVGAISADPDGSGARKRRATKTTYNSDGQPTVSEVGTVDGTSDTDWAAFVSAQQVTATYDANARKTKDVVTANSTTYQVTQYGYDSLGRPECSALRMNSATWSSLPTSACAPGTAGSYGNDRIAKTSYDAVGNVTKVQNGYGVTGVQADEVSTAYTDNGRVQSVTDAEGNKTTYNYDGFDRLSKTSYPSPTKGAGTSSSTDYEELIYNANDNVLNRRLRGYASDVTRQIGFTYDKLNRVAFKDLPGSEPDVTYTYDLLGRMTGASQTGNALTFGYDALSRNTSQGGPNGTVNYQYDAAGRRTRTTWPDSFYVSYDHQVTGEVTVVRENGASSGIGVLATYAYDDLGRRSSITRGNGTSTSYGFDSVSRLDSLALNLAGTANDVTTTFVYSPASQIAGQTRTNDAYAWAGHANLARSYTSNGLNQYSNVGGITPIFDARGNLTGLGSDSYGYSSENLITSATVASAATTLSYDPALRLYQVYTPANSKTLRFQYDGADLIAEYNASNAMTARHVHGPGTDEPLVTYTGTGLATRTWLNADERGSIVAIADDSGAATAKIAYDEYGRPGTVAARFAYTGQIYIPSLALYYYKARMYSPALGRFMQTDPIGYAGGMHSYNYVGSDPVNFTDPSGNCGSGQTWTVATGTHIGRCVPTGSGDGGGGGGGGIATGFSPGAYGLGSLRGWSSGYWSCDNCDAPVNRNSNEILVVGYTWTYHPGYSIGWPGGASYGASFNPDPDGCFTPTCVELIPPSNILLESIIAKHNGKLGNKGVFSPQYQDYTSLLRAIMTTIRLSLPNTVMNRLIYTQTLNNVTGIDMHGQITYAFTVVVQYTGAKNDEGENIVTLITAFPGFPWL